MVVDAAHAAGIDACMCGEMAGEPEYLPVLLGLGFDELSMNAISLLRVKKILRRCSKTEAEKIVARALAFPTAQEVELFVKSEIAAHYSESFDYYPDYSASSRDETCCVSITLTSMRFSCLTKYLSSVIN